VRRGFLACLLIKRANTADEERCEAEPEDEPADEAEAWPDVGSFPLAESRE